MVRAELQALPADQKESLMLAFVEGLSHHEIAARLACPLGTVKSRVRRSLISMRAPLQVLLWVPNRERDPNDCTVAAACDGFASALAIRSRRHMAGPSVEAAMHERKAGTLESGGSGKKGTSRKQAIAIGLSEAREEGGKVPSAIAARSSKPFARGNEGDPNRVGGTPERRTDGLPAALPRVR